MKRKLLKAAVIVTVLIAILILIWYLIGKSTSGKDNLTAKVIKGDFNITVTTSGELEAKSCDYIYGPVNLKNLGIWQIKINDIIPEGTIVKRGDYVATLDPTEISNKLKDIQADMDKNLNLLNKTKLDTTFDLRNERDKLASLKFNLDEAQVNLDQSKYEPPATIRQAELELERDKRTYNQALKNYKLKFQQDYDKVQEINIAYNNDKEKYEHLNGALNSLTLKAPKDGILLYKRERGIDKISAGSVISTYTNIVAIMPDLSQIISKTNINEMDISKVSTGMEAEVTLDAFPEKKYKGNVIYVANIGQSLPGSSSKFFEVKILLNSPDKALKPSMTTKNIVLVNTVKDAAYLPIECIHTENNLQYVYKVTNTGIIKTEVITAQSNDNQIIITKGLDEGDIVSLAVPDKAENLELKKL